MGSMMPETELAERLYEAMKPHIDAALANDIRSEKDAGETYGMIQTVIIGSAQEGIGLPDNLVREAIEILEPEDLEEVRKLYPHLFS